MRPAERSFAFHMIHILVMRIDTAAALAATTAAFLVSLGLAWTLYVIVEQRCRHWILRDIQRPRRLRLPLPAEH
ncbi:hypothetical protein HUT19_33975 [Streptomyces sp. NA02950]|uniref:hypothetical protein n=1 Tax=Streptomyces sp. NA02950 TaxID=2742137 RepID=UPI00159108F5|nr:hypothetical protein [Streptomyces sp. NA02950]QKV96115.1 hypothetical protein HUT19_33975 [Streptomyces sp. NA02950]